MQIKFDNENCSGIKIIAEINNKKIGRAYLYILYNDLHQKPFGFLEDVFVNEEHRGEGVGQKLISEVIKKAKEEGCYKLICTSRYKREKVHQFYEKLGFEDYGKEFRMNL